MAVSCDGDKSLRSPTNRCFLKYILFSCIHHLYNLVSRYETDPGRIQLSRAAYARIKEAFDTEDEKLKNFPDVYMKIQHVNDEQWAFYDVRGIVFGKLSAQFAECFTSFTIAHGIGHCIPLNMLEFRVQNATKDAKKSEQEQTI